MKLDVKQPRIEAVLAAAIVTVLPDKVTPVPLTEDGVIATSPVLDCRVLI